MMENKNFIIAIVLSVAVMFIWTEFFAPKPEPVETAQTENVQKEKEEQKASDQSPEKVELKETEAQPVAPTGVAPQTEVSHPEKKGEISNGSLKLSYSSKKGKITASEIIRKKYLSKEIDLSVGMYENSFVPEMSSVFSREPDYEVEKTEKRSVQFKYESGNVIERKKIALKDDFNLVVSKTVTNNTSSAIEWKPSLKMKSQFKNEEILSSIRKTFNIVMRKPGGIFEECDDNDELNEFLAGNSEVDWIGINYGYFLFAVLPGKDPYSVETSIDEKKNFSQFEASLEKKVLQPGESYTAKFKVFYGPKERDLLVVHDAGLEQTVSFGWTGFLAEPLLLALNFIYKYVLNYGIAIILLTLFVKLLLFPLSNASYKSMSKMKKLQPKMKELQEKYKNDKETLNKETMQLYQKEGVNPLGGCLPMFIQMPVYIALYYMIQNAVELYNAPFLPFWLTDLSEKDPFYIIPVALGLLMFFQTKLNPQQMDNRQAKIMMYGMPLVFTYISLQLPSGMTLYWLVNTLLGILQQVYVNKKYS
jgi:YidC/Oxa1 family membrane protein insertase